MNKKLILPSLFLAAALASASGACAQSTSDTVNGRHETKTEQMRRMNTEPGTTTGSALPERAKDQTDRQIKSDSRLPENVPADATEGAPAGR